MSTWKIDPAHSVAAFSVKHMMVTNVRGQFNDVTGTIRFDPSDIAGSSVEAKIEVASLTTGNARRDEHLRSPDFFDAAKYPEITFKSTKVEPAGSNHGRITGELTIRGTTRTVSMEAEYNGPVKSPQDLGGETTMGFSASLAIDREDYGVNWNVPLDGGGLVVGKEVWIMLDVEADLEE
jgi:polyisoprenoid-binding protein YceI